MYYMLMVKYNAINQTILQFRKSVCSGLLTENLPDEYVGGSAIRESMNVLLQSYV